MTTTQATSPKTSREAALAKMAARTAQQSTATLCEALVIVAGMPRTPETSLVRADVIEVLCERHPEVETAAEAWAFGDDETPYEAVIVAAALTAIGA